MKPTHYSSADYKTVESLFDMLKGLGLLSIGGGLAYGSIRGVRKRFFEATAPDIVQPSTFVRMRMKDKRIPVDPEYLSDTDETDSENEKKAAYLVNKFTKYAAEEDPMNSPGVVEWVGRNIGSGIGHAWQATSSGFRSATTGTDSPDPSRWYDRIEGYRPLSAMDINELKRKGVTLHSLEGARSIGGMHRIKAELAARPGLRSAWFLPSAVAVTLGGFSLGRVGASAIERALGKPKQELSYASDAQKIYEQSAKYLKDVASGKDVDDPDDKKKKKKKKKDLEKKSGANDVISGDGSTTFWGLSSLVGIPAALLVARQLHNFNEGVGDVQAELADRTHMIRAWQAAAKERQYDYNDLASELTEEPADDATAKRLLKEQENMLKDIHLDDNPNQLKYENFTFNEIRDAQNNLT